MTHMAFGFPTLGRMTSFSCSSPASSAIHRYWLVNHEYWLDYHKNRLFLHKNCLFLQKLKYPIFKLNWLKLVQKCLETLSFVLSIVRRSFKLSNETKLIFLSQMIFQPTGSQVFQGKALCFLLLLRPMGRTNIYLWLSCQIVTL